MGLFKIWANKRMIVSYIKALPTLAYKNEIGTQSAARGNRNLPKMSSNFPQKMEK